MAADDIYYSDLSIKSLTLLSKNKNSGLYAQTLFRTIKIKILKKFIKY